MGSYMLLGNSTFKIYIYNLLGKYTGYKGLPFQLALISPGDPISRYNPVEFIQPLQHSIIIWMIVGLNLLGAEKNFPCQCHKIKTYVKEHFLFATKPNSPVV